MRESQNSTDETLMKQRNNGVWITVLYFAEGFPYTIVIQMSTVFLKTLGASNILIGLSTLLYIPWILKGLWGPIVEIRYTKRRWILSTEKACVILLFTLAISIFTTSILTFSLICLSIIAFVSATHDVAIDGFYLDALDKNQQAFFSGIRTTAYKIAWLVGNGGLVFLSGYIADRYLIGTNAAGERLYQFAQISIIGLKFSCHPVELGWASVFGISAVVILGIYVFQTWYLPYPASDVKFERTDGSRQRFINAFKTYFTQYRIGWIVTYVLIFRLGDAFMLKMAQPFLMDPRQQGGLGISTTEIGILYGTVGMIFLLAGGIVGGFLVSKYGLKRWMWPTAVLQSFAIAFYWLLAITRPSMPWVYVVNSFEQFSYGLGVSAYTIFLMRTIRPEYRASHYAITTAFMAIGMLIPGVISGYLQSYMGYQHFFLMSFLVAIPGLMTIFFLPLEEKN